MWGWSWLPEELDVAGLTVRVVTVFLEGALVEEFEAEGTGEVFRVPLAAHGSNTLAYRTNNYSTCILYT